MYKEYVYTDLSTKVAVLSSPKNTLCIPLHAHKRVEILRVSSGSAKIKSGKTVIDAKKGDIMFIFPGTPHECFAKEIGVEFDIIMFDLALLKNDIAAFNRYIEIFENNYISYSEIIHSNEVSEMLDSLYEICKKHPPKQSNYCSFYILGRIYTLFAELCRCIEEKLSTSIYADKSFGEIISYINANYTKNITTQSISEHFKYNESYFSRRFKEVTGVSSTKYIHLLRLQHAKSRLLKKDAPINKIAKESGFSDINYFNRCFKKYYGVPPSKIEIIEW